MGYRDYSVAKGHIVDATGHGDFLTLTAALAAASSGEDIFVRPGTYTEDITLKAGVNITGFPGDETIPNVTLVGKMSFAAAGNVNVSNMALETNEDYILEVSGSAASVVDIRNCEWTVSDNTAINYTSTSTDARVSIIECRVYITASGITLFTSTSVGVLQFEHVQMSNTGASTTASTCSAGILALKYNSFLIPLSVSGTTIGTWDYNNFNTASINTTAMTFNIAGSINATNNLFASGTATALVISAGNLSTRDLTINSTNASALSGAGTLQYNLITYTGSSSTNSVTTQFKLTTQPNLGTQGTWTPVITFNSTPSVGAVYVTQVGVYYRTGNEVSLYCRIEVSNKGTSTGNLGVGGIPFTMGATAGQASAFAIGRYSGLTLAGGRTQVGIFGNNSLSVLNVQQMGSGVSFSAIAHTAVAASTVLEFSGTYSLD